MTTLLSGLPGQELWQPYLEAAPQSAEAFAQDPLGALLSLLPVHPVQLLTQIAHSYIAVFLFLLASVVSFAFRGNGGIFLGAAGLFSFLLSGYGFYVGMKSFKEEQVSHRMSVLGSITSGGMLVAWLALFLIGVR